MLKTLTEISQFSENYESAMKDKNKLLLDKNPLFSLATVNTEGLSKEEFIAATAIISKESRIIQTIKI